MLKNDILKAYQPLCDQILQMQNQLNELPKGKLLISRKGKYVKWYVSDGHTKTYIPKKKPAISRATGPEKIFVF